MPLPDEPFHWLLNTYFQISEGGHELFLHAFQLELGHSKSLTQSFIGYSPHPVHLAQQPTAVSVPTPRI